MSSPLANTHKSTTTHPMVNEGALCADLGAHLLVIEDRERVGEERSFDLFLFSKNANKS